jgi:hypothetical protein
MDDKKSGSGGRGETGGGSGSIKIFGQSRGIEPRGGYPGGSNNWIETSRDEIIVHDVSAATIESLRSAGFKRTYPGTYNKTVRTKDEGIETFKLLGKSGASMSYRPGLGITPFKASYYIDTATGRGQSTSWKKVSRERFLSTISPGMR